MAALILRQSRVSGLLVSVSHSATDFCVGLERFEPSHGRRSTLEFSYAQ